MIGTIKIVALAALVALCSARPEPVAQEGDISPLEVQGLLEEFKAISENERARRRREAPEAPEAEEAAGLDAEAVQGLLDEFQAVGERVRRAAPSGAPPSGAPPPRRSLQGESSLHGVLEQFGGDVRVRREAEPLLADALNEFLGGADEQ